MYIVTAQAEKASLHFLQIIKGVHVYTRSRRKATPMTLEQAEIIAKMKTTSLMGDGWKKGIEPR